MGTATKHIGVKHLSLQKKLEKAISEVSRKLIEQEKKNDGYLIISDKDGTIKKIPAKDL
ncbi:hypothetical protein [Rubrolithibacter danxiaensis]|uniref:hypothetical protein n=1 Tax=Rubrolithibacter danxiaensis TaxID=3390805 RepID=UPI003BF80619